MLALTIFAAALAASVPLPAGEAPECVVLDQFNRVCVAAGEGGTGVWASWFFGQASAGEDDAGTCASQESVVSAGACRRPDGSIELRPACARVAPLDEACV